MLITLFSFVSCGTGDDSLEHPLKDETEEGREYIECRPPFVCFDMTVFCVEILS